MVQWCSGVKGAEKEILDFGFCTVVVRKDCEKWKMGEQEGAAEAENEWHAKMDGLTRKSCFSRCQF